MNFRKNSRTGSIFSDHPTPGPDRLLMTRKAQLRQKTQECCLPVDIHTHWHDKRNGTCSVFSSAAPLPCQLTFNRRYNTQLRYLFINSFGVIIA